MKTYAVTFLPEGITVRAAQGRSLLDAAKAAGVAINCICNGDGVCGKCRVIAKSGKVTAHPTMFLDRHDIQRGVAIACQTFVIGDVVVEVPPESTGGGIPSLTQEDAVRYGRVIRSDCKRPVFPVEPLVRKEYLELTPPSLADGTPDQERVYQALRARQDIPVMQTGLAVLRRLPEVLRESDWQVTAVLGCRGGTVEVVDVEPGNTAARNFGVAVDVGTTTVIAHLVNMTTSETLGNKARYNSQSKFGEDVIARIMHAAKAPGLKELQEAIVGDINGLIAALVSDAGVRLADVNSVVCAGNTTIISKRYNISSVHVKIWVQ